jgi:hypothetical protein
MKMRVVMVGVLAICGGMLHAQSWVIGPFGRPASGNPVIVPRPQSTFEDPVLHAAAHWEALHTFNPAARSQGLCAVSR